MKMIIMIFWKASQYIMSASGTNQDNLKFSSCSLEEINKKIEKFVNRTKHFPDFQVKSFGGTNKKNECINC